MLPVTRMWADTQRHGRPAEYWWHRLRKFRNSFLVPRHKVWLTAAAGVPCSNTDNIGERKTWTQSEFCTWQNSVRGQEPPKFIYTVSQKRPTFDSLQTRFDCNNFWQGSQNVLYFPTSPNSCFCTTWGNRKPGNCEMHLNAACYLTKNTKHLKNITWSKLNHPSQSKRSTGCTTQDLGREHSILLSVTHMLFMNQVCHVSVAV